MNLSDPKAMVKLHGALAVIWFLLAVATTAWALWSGESVFMGWLVFMSGYANAGAHWAARQGAAPSVGEAAS